MKKPLLVYIVYGPDEKDLFDRLDAHLAVPKRNGEIEIWERSKILPGQEAKKEICSKLEYADTALLLITANTIYFEDSYQEMSLAISTLQRRHKPVYRIIMRSVSYQKSFLDPIPALPHEDFPPIMEHTYREKAFSEVAEKVRNIASSIAAGNFSFNTPSHPFPSITAPQEVEPKPMLLGFALDVSSSALANLRPNLRQEKNTLNMLIEAAKSVHMTLESNPDLLNHLQTSLFLYAFGLKLRPSIDVYTCMNVAQRSGGDAQEKRGSHYFWYDSSAKFSSEDVPTWHRSLARRSTENAGNRLRYTRNADERQKVSVRKNPGTSKIFLPHQQLSSA